MQQVSMRCVQLNKLQLQANRTPGRVYESVSDAHHFAVTQRHRRMLPVRKSHGARCDRGPAIRSARRNLIPSKPGHFGGSLAAGMCELDANRNGRMTANALDRAADRAFICI